MIDPQALNISSLPWLPLDARAAFPRQPAIYFAIDSQDQIQYIGISVDPKARWSGHHRYGQLQAIGDVRIAYLFVDDAALLKPVESALIAWFDPPLNVVGRAEALISPDRMGEKYATKLAKLRELKGQLKNKVKQFLESRQLSAYQFIKDTGIAPATGYKLAKSSDYLPGIRVLEVICDTYRVQPGELLEWVDEGKA